MNKKTLQNLFQAGVYVAAGFCALTLLFLLGVLIQKGIRAINPGFLLTASKDFGAKGGIFYQLIGTLLLVFFAGVLCLPVALGTAIYKSEYKGGKVFHILLYGLNAVPSIIFGIFGLIFFVNILETGISWFAGSVILACMILPTVTLSSYQAIHSIPQIYRDSAMALGLHRWQVIVKALLPQAMAGAITGLFLGIARAAGETAPIMFIATAFSGVQAPSSFWEPVSALPTHILALAQQAVDKRALENAWGSGLVLIFLVTVFSLLGLWSRMKLKKIGYR